MVTAVTDDQVATLRAQLTGQGAERKQLLATLDQDEVWSGYRALAPAAFCVAVKRKFPRGGSMAQVINLVAEVRSKADKIADKIDPRIAERIVYRVLADGDIMDIPARTCFEHELLLLAALIADEHLDDAGLDEFLGRSRSLADRWLA